ATYISDLVPTNPTGSDQKAQGDDHIRLIKKVLQNTFPTANGALSFAGWALKAANYVAQGTDRTQSTSDNGKMIRFDCTATLRTYNLLNAATAGDGFVVFISKTGVFGLTIDPAGSELVEGVTATTIYGEWSGMLICDGTAWRIFGFRNAVG